MSFDEDFLKYLNLAREHPAYFVPAIQKQIASFINEKEMLLAEDTVYETNEGKILWEQTKDFLMTQKPLPPLKKHLGLLRAAQDHKNDLCTTGTYGHNGSDGSSFSQRILRYCKKGPGAMAEIIGSDFDFANRNTSEMTILGLIIDDGVQERGHRKTIFSPTYKYVGWSSGKQEQKIITVFNFTENNLEEQYKLADDYFTSTKKQEKVFSKSLGFTPNTALRDATNFTEIGKLNQVTQKSDLPANSSKKVHEKFEDSKIYYEGTCKIIQTTVRYIYRDGTIEQNTQKRTIFPDQ